VLYLTFIFFLDKYNKFNEQQNVNIHAKIISKSLWSFNPDMVKDYLQLACKAHKYKKLDVLFSSNKEFISIDYDLDNSVDLFFNSLSLFSVIPLKSEIFHKGQVIGKISVEWYNTAIYINLYVFIIVLLLLTVFWFFLSTLKQKYELEDRVMERTADLKKEIEERKQVEESLQIERDNLHNIFEAIQDGIYIVNQQYEIQYVNPVLVKDFGSYENVKCYRYFHDRDEVCPWCKNRDVQAGKTVRWEWYSSKNGKTYDLLDTPMTLPDGSRGKLEIFRDITERKEIYDELEKHREHLEELVKERTAELEERNAELERMNSAFVGREFRIKELRDRVKELELTIVD